MDQIQFGELRPEQLQRRVELVRIEIPSPDIKFLSTVWPESRLSGPNIVWLPSACWNKSGHWTRPRCCWTWRAWSECLDRPCPPPPAAHWSGRNTLLRPKILLSSIYCWRILRGFSVSQWSRQSNLDTKLGSVSWRWSSASQRKSPLGSSSSFRRVFKISAFVSTLRLVWKISRDLNCLNLNMNSSPPSSTLVDLSMSSNSNVSLHVVDRTCGNNHSHLMEFVLFL